MIWIVIWLKQLNNTRPINDLKRQNLWYLNKYWAQISVSSLNLFNRKLKRKTNLNVKSIGFYDTFYDVINR